MSAHSAALQIGVNFRLCQLGESLSNSGQCEPCLNGFYILEAPTVETPCSACPAKANCYGGGKWGPIAGYWRSSVSSLVFIPCFNPAACLGSLEEEDPFNPLGECH